MNKLFSFDDGITEQIKDILLKYPSIKSTIVLPGALIVRDNNILFCWAINQETGLNSLKWHPRMKLTQDQYCSKLMHNNLKESELRLIQRELITLSIANQDKLGSTKDYHKLLKFFYKRENYE